MSTTIDSLELQIKSNSTSAKNGIDALTQSLKKLKTATGGGLGLSSVSKELNTISSSSREASASIDGLRKSSDKSSASFTDFFHKAQVALKTVSKLGKTIWSMIDKSNDYIENVNLFTVAMGEYASSAMDFANNVSDVIGIDTSDWIRNQGVFMTLATGFGVASDRADTMSKNLTQLGYDISSFYNIDVSEAMQKLQSGLSGELEPLRRIGYDLSQAKLEATALELGIDKTVSSMTQAEKAQLRYYAIMTQVTSVHKDMARTLEDPANQVRVLKAQVEMAARSIGNIFVPALKSILPYATAVTKVIREVADSIAALVGDEATEVDSSKSTIADIAETTSEGLESATDSAKKLKSYMLGFDELNVINPNTESAEDASGMFDFALPDYDFLGNATSSKVEGIVTKIKGVLSELKAVIDSLGFEPIIDRLKEFFNVLKGQFEGLDFKTPIFETIKGLLSSNIDLVNLLVQALAPIIEELNVPQIFANSLELVAELFETITDIINALTPALNALIEPLKPIVSYLSGAILDSLNFLTDLLSDIGDFVGKMAPKLERIGGALGELIRKIWDFLEPLTTGIWEGFHTTLDDVNNVLFALIECVVTLADEISSGLNDAFDDLSVSLSPLRDLIGKVLSVFFERLSSVLKYLAQTVLPKITSILTNLWRNVLVPLVKLLTSTLSPVVEIISELFSGSAFVENRSVNILTGAFEELCTILNGVIVVLSAVITALQFLWDKVLKPVADFIGNILSPIIRVLFAGIGYSIQGLTTVVDVLSNGDTWVAVGEFFVNLWKTVSGFFVGLWEDIVGIWNTVAAWFNEKVVQPIVDFFAPIVEWISSFFEGCWLIIQAVWIKASTWFDETFVQPLIALFDYCKEKIIASLTYARDSATERWNEFTTLIKEKVIQPVVDNFNYCKDKVVEAFNVAWDFVTTKWGEFTAWVDETVIQPVKTVFENACSAISNTFTRMWSSIKIGAINAMNAVIGGIEVAINWILEGINKLIGGFSKVVEWAADVVGEDWGGLSLIQKVSLAKIPVPEYATGAFDIPAGQLFVAREAGAEMVGSIGRKTAVANNDQIVGGIASGVAEANSEQNALLREQNSLLRAILEKDSGVYLDGRSLTNSVEKYQHERGRQLVTGGVM